MEPAWLLVIMCQWFMFMLGEEDEDEDEEEDDDESEFDADDAAFTFVNWCKLVMFWPFGVEAA